MGTPPWAPKIRVSPAHTSSGPSGPGQGRAGQGWRVTHCAGEPSFVAGALEVVEEPENKVGGGGLAPFLHIQHFLPSAMVIALSASGAGMHYLLASPAGRLLQVGVEGSGVGVPRPENPSSPTSLPFHGRGCEAACSAASRGFGPPG